MKTHRKAKQIKNQDRDWMSNKDPPNKQKSRIRQPHY